MYRFIKSLFVGLSLYGCLVVPVAAEATRPVVCPAVTDAVWGVTSYACMQESVEYTLNITSTENIETWQTKYSGSFTRTGEINVFDFEAILQTGIPTDVMGMYGGRRVTNIVTNKDLTIWTESNAIVGTIINDFYPIEFLTTSATVRTVLSGSYISPSAQTFGSTPIITLSTEAKTYTTIGTTSAGQDFVFRVEVKSGTVDKMQLYFYETTTQVIVYISDGNELGTIYVKNPQVEFITGHTNQNPSNYISTTGSAVTKFYDTENGNTVSSGVVTEAEGDVIESVIGGAFWPSTTNVIGSAQYRDFSHADWNKVNGSITAGDVVLIDGTTVADKNTFTASAANATIILNPYVSASGVHSGGIFVKRKTGTEAIEATMDGGSTWVDKTSEVASDAGWHLPQTTLPTVTDPEIGLRLVGSGDAVYLDWAQMDDGYARVSVHPIGGGDTLGAQSLIAADAANASKLIKDKQGYVIAEIEALSGDSALLDNSSLIYGGAFTSQTIYMRARLINTYDGTTIQSCGPISGLTKIATFWADSKRQTVKGGVAIAETSYDGSWATNIISIGGNYRDFSGIISKVIFGAGIKTTQAEMEEATTESLYIPVGYVRVVDGSGNYIVDGSGLYMITPR